MDGGIYYGNIVLIWFLYIDEQNFYGNLNKDE